MLQGRRRSSAVVWPSWVWKGWGQIEHWDWSISDERHGITRNGTKQLQKKHTKYGLQWTEIFWEHIIQEDGRFMIQKQS